MSKPSNFSSVKLPTGLVNQAREAAQPMRRSVAGQIEYWAALGQVVEHAGLSVQESRAAIEAYEAAGRQARATAQAAAPGDSDDSLEALKRRVLAVSTDGTLQAHIRQIVADNRKQAKQQVAT